jgi:phage shock protein C
MNKLTKSQKDKMIFGVCGGLSEYTHLSSAIIRLGFIFGTILTGSILLWIYLILAILLPLPINK